MDQSLGKNYKLCNKEQIDSIFEEGNSQKQFPLVARYKELSLKDDVPFQIVIAAPKRTFKSAFQRNRIKRICREVVRKNKGLLESWLVERNRQLGIFLLYTGKVEMSSEKLNKKTQDLFSKIIDDLERNHA